MTSNVAGLVREGVAALKAGRKEEALTLLRRATELDERNEEAWLWLSAAVDSLENQQICLENVLAINPSNTRALQGLEMIKRQLARKQQRQTPSPPPPPAAPQATPPFEFSDDPSYRQPPSEPFVAPAGPFAAPVEDAASFHGSGRAVPQPSEDEYDAWVEGLNLGKGSSAPAPEADAELGEVFGFEGGPFQSPELEEEPLGWGADEGPADVTAYGDMVSPDPGVVEPGGRQIDPFALPAAAPFADETDEFGGAEPDEEAYAYDSFSGMAGEFSSASPFGGFGPDEAVEDANELKRFFAYIPPDIPATHLPGQGPKHPRGLLVGLFAVSGGLVLSLVVMVYLLLSR